MTNKNVAMGLVIMLVFAMATGMYERNVHLIIGAGLLQTIVAFCGVLKVSELQHMLEKKAAHCLELLNRISDADYDNEVAKALNDTLRTVNEDLNAANIRNNRELQRLRMKTPAVNKLQAHNEQLERKVSQLQQELAKERSENKRYFRPGRRQPISSNPRS